MTAYQATVAWATRTSHQITIFPTSSYRERVGGVTLEIEEKRRENGKIVTRVTEKF